MPFQDPAGRWAAVPGLTAARRDGGKYKAASGQLHRLTAGVAAAAWQLRAFTSWALLARSGLRPGGAA